MSVVLCTYDPDLYRHFREAAESVLSQRYQEVELVVVVDGNDELATWIEADLGEMEDVIIHVNNRNRGLLTSRNNGAETASGDIVAFIDDDAVADERWIEELVAVYREFDAIAAGGKMIPNWVAGKPAHLPEEFYWLVGVTHRGFAEEAGEVRNTNGSNLSFRRDIFLDLNGFDSEVGGRKGDANLQGGETELCARMRAKYGRGVVYNPDAVVAHKIFEYRTRLTWLLNRCFWQGYSKRGMETILQERADEEIVYLRALVIQYLPYRVKGLILNPSLRKLEQLLMIIVFTFTVGLGYLYGGLRLG